MHIFSQFAVDHHSYIDSSFFNSKSSVPSLTSCVTLDGLVNLSVLHFLHLCHSSHYIELLGGLNKEIEGVSPHFLSSFAG